MRSSILAIAFLFLTVTAATATEVRTPTVPAPELASQSAPAVEQLQLTKVQQTEPAASDAAVAVQPARGSFWWIVGAIVVAGVILSVLL